MKYTLITFAALSGIAFGQNFNLVTNGDFEANKGAPSGWTVGGATQSPVAYPNSTVVPAAGGAGRALDLGPSGVYGDNGGYAEQTITFADPGTYTLSFDYIGEVGKAGLPFDVTLTGAATLNESILTDSTYTTYTKTFEVTAPGDATLRFTDTVTSGGLNAVVDNVSIVPEPSSTALLGLGGLASLPKGFHFVSSLCGSPSRSSGRAFL